MRNLIVLILIFEWSVFSYAFGLFPSSSLTVNVNEDTGAFNISLNNEVWFGSTGKGISFQNEGINYSIDDGSLIIGNVNSAIGRDTWGRFKEIQIYYQTIDTSKTMIGFIRSYKRAITFEQKIINSLNNTSIDDVNGIITKFPILDIDNKHIPDSSCLWTSWDSEFQSLYDTNWISPTCRDWSETTSLPGGIAGTGPMVIWSESMATTTSNNNENDGLFPSFILSPMENVMALSLDASSTSKNGQAAYGIIGNASFVPDYFSTKTVLFLGQGINGVVSDWGSAMRKWYGKQDAASARRSDVTLQYLGYSTDNGAYYYYQSAPNMNYEETMKAVKDNADTVGLPFRYQLLDSWWYEHGEADGVERWDAVSDVFPDGMSAVYNQTKLLIQAHNRWWDPSNVYATDNGGEFDFIIDEPNGGALPLQQAFWDNFLSDKAGWGLRVYEQDWLYNEFLEKVSLLQQDPTLGRRWLSQMNQGALKNGLTIQYCMPHMRHLLQSLEFQAVTQARASDDYKPSNQQWAIGAQNVLLDALGIAPSKDSFWSVSDEPGNPYEGTSMSYEPYPETQALVTTLSAGPVAPSDAIGLANVDLIMRSCMKDGRLLQPSAPAKLIDRAFRFRANPDIDHGVDGEVWGALSLAAGRTFGYVFAANVTSSISIVPSDLLHLGTSHFSSSGGLGELNQMNEGREENDSESSWVAVNVRDVLSMNTNQYSPSSSSSVTIYGQEFSKTSPLEIKPCDQNDFNFWAILPIEPGGQLAYFGEIDKWIGTSSSRLLTMSSSSTSISSTTSTSTSTSTSFGSGQEQGSDTLTVELIGSVGEVLSVGFVDINNGYQLNVIQCAVTETGRIFISETGCKANA